MEKLYTTEEIAEYLKVDVVTVRRLVNRGDLTAYRIGGEYRFTETDITDFVKRQRVPTVDQANQDAFRYFTERARKTLALAHSEAQKLGHNYMGTEHMLLGLAAEGEGIAARALSNFDFDLDKAREAIVQILKRGQERSPVMSKIKAAVFQGETGMTGGQVGLTRRARKVIELSVVEAKRLGHHYIGTEHLLLGIITEGDGLAVGVLEYLGINPQELRAKTMEILRRPADVTQMSDVPGTDDEVPGGKMKE